MNVLIISDTKQFDEDVWQTHAYFNEQEYNKWLHNTAIATLKQIYDTYEGNADVYVLGDVINMLQTIKIKTLK